MKKPESVAIIGGCGHVGLPLGLSFARAGLEVKLYDINRESIRGVSEGRMPFVEESGEELLRAHIGKNLTASSDPKILSTVDTVICVIGTPIDEHLNPKLDSLLDQITKLSPYLTPNQLFVLRSTVYPGATTKVHAYLQQTVPGIDVAFCPERVVQGLAIKEIQTHPQIVSGIGEKALARARALFAHISPMTVDLPPLEAELGKLFCNAWRYITFAVANQLYAVCAENGIDYYSIWNAITEGYPRMKSLPKAGFAAGPCLLKDTMQLASFFPNYFPLGQAAMLVNESLPTILVRQLQERFDLPKVTVGILGMAFKGDNDDIRESLAFKLRKLLRIESRQVLCTDPFVQGENILPLEEVLEKAQVLVIAAPHTVYKTLRPTQAVLDPWNHLGRGGLIT